MQKDILFNHSFTLTFFEKIPNLSFVETLQNFSSPALVESFIFLRSFNDKDQNY